MKRGENGSSNVSMEFLRQSLPYYFILRSARSGYRTNLYTISGTRVTDMTVLTAKLPNPLPANQSVCPRAAFCSAT
jgi:hypothetical protein